ncbi:SDR family NAD(P)-dependent oxidoreductase [Desertivirga arenae]|uniref:SDR family NAD(P)-dependent oxidoreductase n=1 Tax=Desertivirga arenae TaxID=2810309 RepID=UPI001A97D278|nr:SDR family oxidoreductase [Pedobacter sp. SYSU D00823]
MNTLENKTAFVTGGSRGIGAAIVRALAEDGASVTFTYSNSAEQAEALIANLESKGYRVKAVQADNRQRGAITAAIEELVSSEGGLDILVNSAGTFIVKPFEEHTWEDYDRIMAVNVEAIVEACMAASKLMSTSGRIISIGSSMAKRVSAPMSTLYSMSKSALVGLTKGLARDLGTKGITVNLVQPGSVNTEMNPETSPFADFQRSLMAIPQFGKPEHIASMVSYLASPQSSYTTGSIIDIDGGYHA